VIVYTISAVVLISGALLVFRVLVRRDYGRNEHLSAFSSFLELLIWGLCFAFPYIYNPPDWPWFWKLDPRRSIAPLLGLVCIALGMALAFGTMSWFGLRRVFGLQVDALIQTGPYRASRNPQILGGALMVIGSAIQSPSWYALGWILLYGAIAHMMVLTEEEHLLHVHGPHYESYRNRVPRYLGLPRVSEQIDTCSPLAGT
jgi:protein-S-isoprenylcysteine O-methyltransferase Ste14